jgi:ElaA protein
MNLRVGVTGDIAACLALRLAVFTGEQGVAVADEVDGRDDDAVHLLAVEDGRPVGTARLLIDGIRAKIGRVCVTADRRGAGIGQALMAAAMAELRACGVAEARLAAQTSALAFYERLGFAAEGPVFDDAGIPHRTMTRTL